MADHVVREYDRDRDAGALRACFVALQDFEHGLDPGRPAGGAVADAYLERMITRCALWNGKVFVAEVDGVVVGFVSVWATVQPEEPDENPTNYAYVSDLVVLAPYRRRGLGRALLRRAEEHARAAGAARLKLGVLAANRTARRLYAADGYSEYHIEFAKPL